MILNTNCRHIFMITYECKNCQNKRQKYVPIMFWTVRNVRDFPNFCQFSVTIMYFLITQKAAKDWMNTNLIGSDESERSTTNGTMAMAPVPRPNAFVQCENENDNTKIWINKQINQITTFVSYYFIAANFVLK